MTTHVLPNLPQLLDALERVAVQPSARRKRLANRRSRPGRSVVSSISKGSRSLDDWVDLDQFSAHASRGVLRHMTEEEEAADLSWDKLRPE